MKAALASRLRAFGRRAADWCARGIGLPAERTRVDWFVRLFFHAPPPGRPDHVRRWVRIAFLRLAHDWGVLQPLSVREWLWRAIVRAPRAADGRPAPVILSAPTLRNSRSENLATFFFCGVLDR